MKLISVYNNHKSYNFVTLSIYSKSHNEKRFWNIKCYRPQNMESDPNNVFFSVQTIPGRRSEPYGRGARNVYRGSRPHTPSPRNPPSPIAPTTIKISGWMYDFHGRLWFAKSLYSLATFPNSSQCLMIFPTMTTKILNIRVQVYLSI